MNANNFAGYIAHGVSTSEYLSQFATPQAAAEDMHDYITGEAADETATYDPDAAAEMRDVHYGDVLAWVRSEWKTA
jgi:hypothetical protein